jgi:hypothetical protein
MPLSKQSATTLTAREVLLQRFRRSLNGHPQIARSVRAMRAIVHFGPWRHAFRALIRLTRPVRALASPDAESLLSPIDAAEADRCLRTESVFMAGRLPLPLLSRIRRVVDTLPVGAYTHFHHGNSDVQALVQDPAILAVLREHFGCEPELLECTLVVLEPGEDGAYRIGSQRWFHFDFGGWHSLNLFVYLTDVDADTAAHEVATGTHRRRGLRDAVHSQITDEQAYARFGPQIRTITGAAGTMFFENTEAFHRRGVIGGRRVMLNVLFASHRGLLSHGRPGRPFSEYQSALQRRAAASQDRDGVSAS